MLALRRAASSTLFRSPSLFLRMSLSGTVHSRDHSPVPAPPAKKPRLGSPTMHIELVVSSTSRAEDEIPAQLQETVHDVPIPTRGGKRGPKKFKRPPPPEAGSAEDVGWFDIVSLLGQDSVDAAVAADRDYTSPVKFGDELELTIGMLSSNGEAAILLEPAVTDLVIGEALARLPDSYSPWVVKVPFCLPGERVRVKIVKHGRLASSGQFALLCPCERR